MDIKEAKSLIPSYLDKELTSAQLAQFEALLLINPDLQREVNRERQIWSALLDVKSIEPNPAYISNFWTRVTKEEKKWYQRLWVSLPRLVPVYASLVLLVVIGAFLVFRSQSSITSIAQLKQDEVEMIENIEIAENLDVISDLEFWQDLDIIENQQTQYKSPSNG